MISFGIVRRCKSSNIHIVGHSIRLRGVLQIIVQFQVILLDSEMSIKLLQVILAIRLRDVRQIIVGHPIRLRGVRQIIVGHPIRLRDNLQIIVGHPIRLRDVLQIIVGHPIRLRGVLFKPLSPHIYIKIMVGYSVSPSGYHHQV